MIEKSYVTVVESIKKQIRSAQHRAILNANKEMLILYWNIGKVINENSTWGSKFLNKLSTEISNEFPSAKGFSVRNLKNMARFYREYPDIEIVQSVTAQITWTHNIEILRVESKEQRLWYINKTIENGWSVNVLAHQIDTNLYARQIEQKKVSNFPTNLPSPQSEYAMVGGNLHSRTSFTTACWPVQKSISGKQVTHRLIVGPSLAMPPLKTSAFG